MDSGAVAVFLIIVGALFAAWLALIIVGARIVRRTVVGEAKGDLDIGIIVVALLDGALLLVSLTFGRGGILLAVPALVHGFVWLVNRSGSS